MNYSLFIKQVIYRFDYLLFKSRGSKVIFYHDVDNMYTEMGTPMRIIEEHFRIIRECGFTLVDVIKEKKNEIMVCFDDGWAGIYNNKSFFIDNNIRPTVFLAVDLIGKDGYLSQSQIQELHGMGFHFECHTWSHQDLTTFNEEDLIHEIIDSRNALEEIVGDKITAICFPMGRYSNTVLRMAKRAGYSVLYSSINGCYFDLLNDERLVCRNLVQDIRPKDFRFVLMSRSPFFQRRTKRLHFVK